MSEPLDESYFSWLYNQVGNSRVTNPARSYWRMLRQLYTKEFVWVIPNDDNRIADGIELRYEFVDQSGLNDVDPSWIQLGCSMLELIIGLSRRIAFIAEGEPRDWFWVMIKNLRVQYNDAMGIFPEEQIEETLNRVIWRTYSFDGHGGIFPLKATNKDQTKVELWYQMCEYVLEQD